MWIKTDWKKTKTFLGLSRGVVRLARGSEVRARPAGGVGGALQRGEVLGVGARDGVVRVEVGVEAVLGILQVHGSEDADDEEADRHADGAEDEQRLAAEAVDGPDGGRGGDEVDGGHDALEDDGLDARGLENGRAEIHERVDAGEHLQELQQNAHEHELDYEAAAEDLAVAGHALLGLLLHHGLHLRVLVLDGLWRGALAEELHGSHGALGVALHELEARRLGHEQRQRGQRHCEDDLRDDGAPPGLGVGLGESQVDEVRHQDAESDGPLVEDHHGAAHVRRRHLALVDRHHRGQHADGEPGERAAGVHDA